MDKFKFNWTGDGVYHILSKKYVYNEELNIHQKTIGDYCKSITDEGDFFMANMILIIYVKEYKSYYITEYHRDFYSIYDLKVDNGQICDFYDVLTFTKCDEFNKKDYNNFNKIRREFLKTYI